MTLDVYADLFDDDLESVATALDAGAAAADVGKVWGRVVIPRFGSLLGKRKNPRMTGGFGGGSDRHRSGDLSIFSRTLYQLSYRAEASSWMPTGKEALHIEGLLHRDPDGT